MLEFDEVAYGVGGVELYDLGQIEAAQTGYSVDTSGRSLVGDGPGDWRSDWIVIGNEIACGDPVFVSIKPPHPVFTAVHGQGEWTPELIAPSIERFWECLEAFRRFAIHRGSPVEAEANPPGGQEIEGYLEEILRLCDANPDTVVFWAVQAEIGMNAEES